MNTILMNTISLDDGKVIVKGGGGGGVSINNQDKTVEIVENGTTEVTADAGYTGLGKVMVNVNVPSSGGGEGGGGGTTPSRPTWTGHADAEGLRAIGWTDEDIAYYQEHGVNWNAEDDEYHKVTDDNKALYGVLTADNISSYKDRIVYLPKIDSSGKTSMSSMFSNCYSLVSIPQLDTQNVTSMSSMFSKCYSLVTAKLKNAKLAYQLNYSTLLSKDSLLHIINNEAATSAITIKLASYAYTKLANDADVVAALANHPNISISQ